MLRQLWFSLFNQPSMTHHASQEPEHHLSKPLYSLYNQQHKTLSHAAFTYTKTFDEIQVTEDEAKFLQKATTLQSQCLTWHKHRKGRVTASYFHDVYHYMVNGQCYPTSLMKRSMQYTDVPDVGAWRWGRENKDKACQEYISNIIAKHHALVVTTSGLVISPKCPFLGASPDGVVNCECHGCSLLEIKCSYKYCNQQQTAEIALSDSSYFLKRGENGNIYNVSIQIAQVQVLPPSPRANCTLQFNVL